MRAVVQRVSYGKVTVEGETTGEIQKGIVVLLGVCHDDTDADIKYLAEKIINLRIFEDGNGKMNISLKDVEGQMLIISQFTLYGDCRRGKRPSYDKAARPEAAEGMYERFVDVCRGYGIKIETGRFQAMMSVEICNEGPVTILLDSRKEF